MAQKVYVGVNGISRNVKNIYVGINGVARKVVKGYVGVNGIARQFWGASSTPSNSWDYWSATAGAELIKFYDKYDQSNVAVITKKNNLIAYYAVVNVSDTSDCYAVILMSPDADAVTYTLTDTGSVIGERTYRGTVTDSNGIVWYWSGLRETFTQNDFYCTPDCVLNDTIYGLNDGTQIVQDILDMIYAVPFHEDYQTNVQSTIYLGNTQKTLRKIYGLALALFYKPSSASNHMNAYNIASDNADEIISKLAYNYIGNVPFKIDIWITQSYSFHIKVYYRLTSFDDQTYMSPVFSKKTYQNLDAYASVDSSDNSLKYARVRLYPTGSYSIRSGQLAYMDLDSTSQRFYIISTYQENFISDYFPIGIYSTKNSLTGYFEQLTTTNLGVDY